MLPHYNLRNRQKEAATNGAKGLACFGSLCLILVLVFNPMAAMESPEEAKRVAEFNKRYETWPPPMMVPSTEGWTKLMEKRFKQVEEVDNLEDRYEGYIQTVTSAFLMPNFTELGFGIGRAPPDLIETMRGVIRVDARLGKTATEEISPVIEGPEPKFVERQNLVYRALGELRPYVEAWAGVPIRPSAAFGFRLYQNNTRENMHLDRSQTHVLSAIIHTGSAEDAEPWPIVLEDFRGRTHELYLTTGDVLFYESAKCLHGRPKKFKGSWYSTLFLHYYPSDGWSDVDYNQEAIYAVPPGWFSRGVRKANSGTKLAVAGTSFKEPECPDGWCNTENAITWEGPAPEGGLVTPDHEILRFVHHDNDHVEPEL